MLPNFSRIDIKFWARLFRAALFTCVVYVLLLDPHVFERFLHVVLNNLGHFISLCRRMMSGESNLLIERSVLAKRLRL